MDFTSDDREKNAQLAMQEYALTKAQRDQDRLKQPTVTMLDSVTKEIVDVPESHVTDAVLSGRYTLKRGETIPVIDPRGVYGSLASEEALSAFKQGYKYQTLADKEEKINRETYGDRPLSAAALGVADALTFGLSNQSLTKSGLLSPEALDQIESRNPVAYGVGEVGGIAASMLTTGGLGVAGAGVRGAAKAGQAAEKATANILKGALKGAPKNRYARKIVETIVPRTAGSAVEGAAYGLGQLISEEALGRADVNAENVAAYMGTGALLGGAFGTAFGGVELAAPIIKKAGERVGRAVRKYADPKDAYLELIGLSPSKRTFYKQNKPKLVEDAVEMFRQEGSLLQSSDDLALAYSRINKEAGQQIGAVLDEIDRLSVADPGLMPAAKDAFGRVAKRIDDEILAPYSETPGFKSKLGSVREISDDFKRLSEEAGPVSVKRLQELRIKMDELAGLEKEIAKKTLGERAAYAARDVLRSEIDLLADRASSSASFKGSGNLLETLKESNKRFAVTAEFLPQINKKIDREKLISFGDLLLGGVGFGAGGGPLAVGAVATKKFLESDLRRKISILADVERANATISRKISTSLKNYFEGSRRVVPPASTSILMNTAIGRQKDKKPKNKVESFKNVQKRLEQATRNVEIFAENVERGSARLAQAAPQTAAAVVPVAQRAAQFLVDKLPKRSSVVMNTLMPDKWEPSSLELSKFERYLAAVEKPMSVLEDLENGRLSREAVEALKVVYPLIYERLRDEAMEYVHKLGGNLSYQKRLELGILLDIPADASLIPENVAALQSNFVTQEQSQQGMVKPSPRALSEVDAAGRALSDTQAFLKRRSES